MPRPASLTVGIFLILLACAQLSRVLFNVHVVAEGIEIPVWMSGVAALVLAFLAYWLLSERNRAGR